MTGPEFSGVDIDLLADYVGGVLDGTPDEAVVIALIADDPAWRAAHAQISAGAEAVTGELRSLGSTDDPMPADVVARLDAALLAAAAPAGLATVTSITSRRTGDDAGEPGAMEPGTDGAAPAPRVVAVPPGSGKRARRLRWAAPVGIAAGVLAFVGFGVQQFSGAGSQDDAASSTAAGAAAEQATPLMDQATTLRSGPVEILASGTDYSRLQLQQARNKVRIADEPSYQSAPDAAAAAAPAELDRLRVRDALQACIDAIAAQQGAEDLTAQSVDFARFQGVPAVIVEFASAGVTWVWASGAACGTPGVGADKLGSVKVG